MWRAVWLTQDVGQTAKPSTVKELVPIGSGLRSIRPSCRFLLVLIAPFKEMGRIGKIQFHWGEEDEKGRVGREGLGL